MGFHFILFHLLIRATFGERVIPIDPKGGSVNYRLMWIVTCWIIDPSVENRRILLDFLQEMLDVGHLTLQGPRGFACEQGAPGMHWTFNVGAILAALKWALKRRDKVVADACELFLRNESALCQEHSLFGLVAMPCARLDDEKDKNNDGVPDVTPHDGYRDVFLALSLDQKIKRKASYWLEEQAFAVALMNELNPRVDSMRGAPLPKLFVPITREPFKNGYTSSLEDSTQAREVLGPHACHRVRVEGKKVSYCVDWNDEWIEVAA